MLPIRLAIKNFGSHLDTEFSFDNFSSAMIIGKVKDNDRFSNGAGKSTIFNSIEYVLFNEIHFSALEKIIRDGAEVCRVEFDFLSSIDKNTYRIVRSNSRKSGSDIRLFKQNKNNWEDFTQRRASDTDKEISKILGFNYKAFCASVLFCQTGSENNVQRDFSNLPILTTEKRKSVLREVLQLNIYANYEKLTKNKYNFIQLNLDKQKTILSTIGEPDILYLSFSKENDNLFLLLDIKNKQLTSIKEQNNKLKSEYTLLSDKASTINKRITDLKSKEVNSIEQISKYKKTIDEQKIKLTNLPNEANIIKQQIAITENSLKEYKQQIINIDTLQIELRKINEEILNIKSLINIINTKIDALNKPITNDLICHNCHQVVSAEHKHNWQKDAKTEILQKEQEKNDLHIKVEKLCQRQVSLEKYINKSKDNNHNISNTETKLKYLYKELDNKRILFTNYNSFQEEHLQLLKEKNIELLKIQSELILLSSNNEQTNIIRLNNINNNIISLSNEELELSNEISTIIGKRAIIQHQIDKCIIDKQKIIDIKSNIQKLEKSLLLHSKVIQAFGSGGIPSLITCSILDDLQTEANKWLLKLRPGLQLQFVILKDQEETLDILYFIDSNQREYKQLSGAQKIIVSLSIKLGILFIMNKRLGVDVKMLLLDEVDQSLDDAGTEVFADIIRVIQNDFKILVITHNNNLKHKFSHAILVEQDENNISKGKLIQC